MKKLLNFLGLHTKSELEALRNQMGWVTTPLIRFDVKTERLVAYTVISNRGDFGAMSRPIPPVEHLKSWLCKEFTEKMFESGVVAFDISDNNQTGEVLLKAELQVVMPKHVPMPEMRW